MTVAATLDRMACSSRLVWTSTGSGRLWTLSCETSQDCKRKKNDHKYLPQTVENKYWRH